MSVTTARKSKGAVSGAPLKESTPPRATRLTAFTEGHDRERSGRLDRLVITDDLFFDHTVPTAVKLWHGAHARHPYRPPTMGEIRRLMPFFTERDHADATDFTARSKQAFVDRSRNAVGGPIRLRNLASRVNTRTPGTASIHIPTAPLARLGTGRGKKEAVLLFGLYNLEQHRRGAVQMPDECAAFRLGWSVDKVRQWRRFLTEQRLVRVHQPRKGQEAAILVIDEALATQTATGELRGAANPKMLDPARTRTLVPIRLGDATLRIYANSAEAEVVEIRLTQASADAMDAVRSLGPVVRASDILDGPLSDPARNEYVDAFELAGYARGKAAHSIDPSNEDDIPW